jgi:(E)-4-hydroxy-3-methylbut-2-enyl-diphosphate synthase
MVEYIACPSCGRTLFNLEDVLHKVRNATSHLKGLDIAVMGCIVNGPGEMADADYGYVGKGPGIIALYRGREEIRKVPEKDGVQALIQLIQEDGLWVEADETR